jgi:hypothetical protein
MESKMTLKPWVRFFVFFFFGFARFTIAQDKTQPPQPYFSTFEQGQILSKNKTFDDLLTKLKPDWKKIKGSTEVNVPLNFEKANSIRPLIHSTAYIFSKSNFTGSAKISKVAFWHNDDFGWGLGYKKNTDKLYPSPQDTEPTDVFCDSPIDVKKLEKLNEGNNEFITQNTLTDAELSELVNNVKSLGAQIATATPVEVKDFKQYQERADKGLWKPTDLFWDKINKENVLFSIKFPDLNIRLAVMTCPPAPAKPYGPPFVVYQTLSQTFFYPVQGDIFYQLINWFGDFYICMNGNQGGESDMTIYKITKTGFKKISQSDVLWGDD